MAAIQPPHSPEFDKDGTIIDSGKPHDEEVGSIKQSGELKKDLRSRHMQMIAIGM